MDLKLVRFIREASERQLVDLCLFYITRYPTEAMEFMAEADEPGINIAPKDVPSLPKAIFISNEVMADLQAEYARGNSVDNVAVIKHLRTLFNIGLKEALDLVRWLSANNYLKVESIYGAPAMPTATPSPGWRP